MIRATGQGSDPLVLAALQSALTPEEQAVKLELSFGVSKGDACPDLEVFSTDGSATASKLKFAAEDSCVYLLDFWATWFDSEFSISCQIVLSLSRAPFNWRFLCFRCEQVPAVPGSDGAQSRDAGAESVVEAATPSRHCLHFARQRSRGTEPAHSGTTFNLYIFLQLLED